MRILVFRGGGIRGALSSRLFARLQAEVPDLLDRVDVLAGTSTGALQCLKLASGGDPQHLVDIYAQRGPDIFKKRGLLDGLPVGLRVGLLVFALAASSMLLAVGARVSAACVLVAYLALVAIYHVVAFSDEFFRSNFKAEDLEKVLKEELGDGTLGDLKKFVLIPTFDMRDWRPKFFDNFPGNKRDAGARLWEVARCTSAAPTYWPSYQWCLDGGLFANDPTDSAIASCVRLLRDKALTEEPLLQGLKPGEAESLATQDALGRISVLCIGTGEVPHQPPRDPRHDAGLLQVAPILLDVVMDGAVKASSFRARQMLGPRYHLMDPKLPGVIGLDEVGAVRDLVQIADLADIGPALDFIREHWAPRAQGDVACRT